jgi:hypothetical protein
MKVETKIHTFDTGKRIEAFERQFGVQTMLEIGGVASSIIQTRTLLGRDVRGSAFSPYSTKAFSAPITNRPPGYPAPRGGKRSKSGKTMRFRWGWRQYKDSLGRGVTPNLSLSNQMLSDIQVKATENTSTLYFGSAESAAKAHGHHFGTGYLPERPFFGIGEDVREKEALEKELVDLTIEYAKRASVPLKAA